jgi:Rrf2 family protein
MITREVDYALRIMLCLTVSQRKTEWFCAQDLAREMHVPYRFLRKIVCRLATARFIITRRGKKGGIKLNCPPKTTSMADVLRVMDSSTLTLNQCLVKGNDCVRRGHCVVHEELKPIQKMLHQQLSRVTLARLAAKHSKQLKAQSA